jgi:hypothetical protein
MNANVVTIAKSGKKPFLSCLHLLALVVAAALVVVAAVVGASAVVVVVVVVAVEVGNYPQRIRIFYA